MMLLTPPRYIKLVIKSSSHSVTQPLSTLLNHHPKTRAPLLTPLSSAKLDLSSPIKFGAPSRLTLTPLSEDMELEVLHQEKQFTMELVTIKRSFFNDDIASPCTAKQKNVTTMRKIGRYKKVYAYSLAPINLINHFLKSSIVKAKVSLATFWDGHIDVNIPKSQVLRAEPPKFNLP